MKASSTIAWFLALVLLAGSAAVAQAPMPTPPPVDDGVTEAVRQNLAAAQAEDVVAYMRAIHEESPGVKITEEKMKKLFADYDLSYTLESLELIESKAGEAKVKFIQVTKKVAGPDYKDNRITGVHVLKRSGDQWKLFATEVKEIEYL